jgi:hypothetical protein
LEEVLDDPIRGAGEWWRQQVSAKEIDNDLPKYTASYPVTAVRT